MSARARLETLFDHLRRTERVERAELLAGYMQDVARIERFLEHPLAIAQREAEAALASMGTGLESELARSLLRESFDHIANEFARLVCASVGLRMRARFRIYANALAEAEVAIAECIVAISRVPTRHPIPKMFAIHRLEIDDLHVPAPPEDTSGLKVWTRALHDAILEKLRKSVEESLRYVLTQGSDRLGVVKTRINLALTSPRHDALDREGAT